jgi:hypothetical protein
MYGVVRRYTNAAELFDELVRRRNEAEEVLRSVPGFSGYYLIRSGDGGASLTLCESQEGTAESTRRTADWVRKNLPDLAARPPEVIEGEVIIQLEK